MGYYLPIIIIIILLLIASFKPIFGIIISIILLMMNLIFILVRYYKFNIEKLMIVFFFLYIPYMVNINIFSYSERYTHHVTPGFYTFNVLQIFSIYFLINILKNKKRMHFDYDIIALIVFFLFSIISVNHAVNKSALIFDLLRYVCLIIVYYYFSRCFNVKKYLKIITYCSTINITIQLLWGIFQKIMGGPIGFGLHLFGEPRNVFRAGVTSFYEKGMSGSFPHPGPLALYGLFVLSWVLFNDKINKKIRFIGVFAATSVIILAAGRTSIISAILIYIIYFINILLKKGMKAKYLVITFFTLGISFILCIVFNDKIQALIERFTNSDIELQMVNRLTHFEIANYYIEKKPFTGIGLNNYVDRTALDFPLSFKTNFYLNTPIHNAYLLYVVEIGMFGGLAYVFFLMNSIKFIFFKGKNKMLIIGFSTAILTYCIYNFQGYAGIYDRMLLMMFLSSAYIYNIANINDYKANQI